MNYPRFNYQRAMPTPWGKADSKHQITKGVYDVGTPGHGGIMVGKAVARKLLSEKARSIGMNWNSWLCYEEDCDWSIFALEQPELYANEWRERCSIQASEHPEKFTTEAIRTEAERTARRWHANYFI